jgi:hypothetical protein
LRVRIEMTRFAEEMSTAGRVEAPRVLYLAWRCGGIDTDELREWILETWSAAEWPVSGIGQRRWLEKGSMVESPACETGMQG